MSRPDATGPTPPLRVLRIAHSAVVSAWRQRERILIDSGVDLTLLSAREWNEGGVAVRLDPGADRFVLGAGTWGRRPNLFCFDPRPLWALMAEEWDVIDIHEEPCSLAAAEILLIRLVRRNRAPYVLYSAQNIDKRYPPPFRWWERAALRHAGGASVCNVAAARILKRKGLRGPAAVIPLGVDVEAFSPAERPEPDATLRVGYVGRLAAHKGVDVLIDAVAGESDWTLSIAGAGPDEVELRKRAGPAGPDRVSFAGAVKPSELARHYRSLDVVAVPSVPVTGWEEQFCRVAVEAMAAGVPLVASRSGALPEVIGEAGILVPPGDPTALHGALAQLVSDPVKWRTLRQLGLQRAAGYSWPAVANGYLHLYHSALRPGPAEPAAADPEPRGILVVVVAYGDPEPLRNCLDALEGQFDLVVVDNSSSPAARAIVADHGGVYVDPGRNLGFAAGVNAALDRCDDRRSDVLLLNPDAVIDPSGIRRLQVALGADPALSCVAPAQCSPDGRPAKVAWPSPTPGRAWLDAFGLGTRPGRHQFVIGSVLMLRRQALDEVGYFDEDFFLYGEEADWQVRARRHGFRSGLLDDVVARHAGAGTGGDPTRREIHFHASHERLIRKYFGRCGWAVCRAGCLAGAALRSAVGPADRRSRARLRLGLYWAGPLRVEAGLMPDPAAGGRP